jgi:hypothetical protein
MDATMNDGTPLPRGIAARLHHRAWPLAMTVAFVVTGMVFSLLWARVVRHHTYWVTPGDLWGSYRAAHFVGWGDLGGVYGSGTALVTFPGILLVLAPMAMLTGALGLTEAFPRFIPYPTAWWGLGPLTLLMSALALFACDALAERLGVSRGRRAVLCVAEAIILWNVAVIWGHPEDAVAVGLAIYALVFAIDGRWTGAGWLFGAAMATQPLVILMFPVILAFGGRRRVVGLAVRGALPAVAIVLTPLISQFHATTHALLDQPNFPNIDHATPWTVLAPVLGGTGRNVAVAAGPGRIFALVLACCLGWWARRWRDRPDLIVLAAATALALRCFTESVMVAFYIWPALAVGLVVAARAGKRHLAGAAVISVGITAMAQWHLGELPWWSIMTAGILAVLVIGARQPAPIPADESDSVTLIPLRDRPVELGDVLSAHPDKPRQQIVYGETKTGVLLQPSAAGLSRVPIGRVECSKS